MSAKITFEPDLRSLAQADQLAAELGTTLQQIASDAFAAYMQSVRDARQLQLDEDSRAT